MQSKRSSVRPRAVMLAVCLAAGLAPLGCWAAREAKVDSSAEGELEARRLYDKARELMEASENERGVRMLESIVEQYPKTRTVYPAYLALGRHCLAAHEESKAIRYLSRLNDLVQEGAEPTPEDRDMAVEAMYLTGIAYFQVRQYDQAFPTLRRITTQYPNTVWANQAHYYIGMCHFSQRNWNKAIEALSLVGTFVDPDSPAVQFAEAGRRFYLKVQDADLPILTLQGAKVQAVVTTARGDRETVDCVPMAEGSDLFLGSVPSAIGLPKAGDQVLQVVGGDAITVRYADANAQDGTPNVPREGKVRVVSTAGLEFMLGDMETRAPGAFLGQPLHVLLTDVDLDTSDQADAARVTLIARCKAPDDEEPGDVAVDKGVSVEKLTLRDDQPRYLVRDEVTLALAEVGEAPVHSGRFAGKVAVRAASPGEAVNTADAVLSCALDDEIVCRYDDALSIDGEQPRAVEARITVSSEIDSRPMTSQDIVADEVVKAKKNLVEATAYLELARIFGDVGLAKGAREKAQAGLERVDGIIRSRAFLPVALQQEAFKLKWDLHLAADDSAGALAACSLFNRLYPDSPFVDEALMGIAKIHLQNKNPSAAIAVLSQVLALTRSDAKPEAQFMIAEATESMARGAAGSDAAIQQYRLCAERYPESPFAGQALAKLIDYHIESKDLAQARSIIEQVFQDYPDANFLDSMLLKWVLVAYRSGNYAEAREKCSQLIFEYPDSPFAAKAKEILPRLDAKLGAKEGEGSGEAPAR